MFRNLVVTASVSIAVVGVVVKITFGAAGELKKPGIAIPSDRGTPDATVAAMNAALLTHERQFIGGHFLNAHSVLQFAGGAKMINALLADLAKIDGAVLQVRFVSGADPFDVLSGSEDTRQRPYDCVVDHHAWADGRTLNITIYLGDKVKAHELSLPAIRGHAGS